LQQDQLLLAFGNLRRINKTGSGGLGWRSSPSVANAAPGVGLVLRKPRCERSCCRRCLTTKEILLSQLPLLTCEKLIPRKPAEGALQGKGGNRSAASRMDACSP
jgi:hypothetical protein